MLLKARTGGVQNRMKIDFDILKMTMQNKATHLSYRQV
jgi:hypothetical protein